MVWRRAIYSTPSERQTSDISVPTLRGSGYPYVGRNGDNWLTPLRTSVLSQGSTRMISSKSPSLLSTHFPGPPHWWSVSKNQPTNRDGGRVPISKVRKAMANSNFSLPGLYAVLHLWFVFVFQVWFTDPMLLFIKYWIFKTEGCNPGLKKAKPKQNSERCLHLWEKRDDIVSRKLWVTHSPSATEKIALSYILSSKLL